MSPFDERAAHLFTGIEGALGFHLAAPWTAEEVPQRLNDLGRAWGVALVGLDGDWCGRFAPGRAGGGAFVASDPNSASAFMLDEIGAGFLKLTSEHRAVTVDVCAPHGPERLASALARFAAAHLFA